MQFNWSPGIGDPTIGGWITVALYLFATVSAFLTAQKLPRRMRERRIWVSISISFLALGINKQLDLQTALTEAGRLIAQYQGWYQQRQLVQLVFISLVAALCLIAIIMLLIWARRSPISTWFALIGSTLVITFVLMRAASFHHIDRFIGTAFMGLRWNWVLEMGGIAIVLLASEWRRATEA